MVTDMNKANTSQEANVTVSPETIYAECVQLTNIYRIKGAFSHLFVSIVPLYIGWGEEVHFSNLFLLSLLWIYSIAAPYLSYRMVKSPPSSEMLHRWGNSLYVQLALLAILYNAIFFNLHLHGIDNALLYLLLLTVIFSSAATSSYQHMKGLGPCFAVFAMAPQFYYYLTQGSEGGTIIALLIATFVVFTIGVSIDVYKSAISSLQTNHELQKYINEVKVLQGIIPICSYCKNIRNNDDSWQQMESYIDAHSEAQFSHGICPECYENVVKKDLQRLIKEEPDKSL